MARSGAVPLILASASPRRRELLATVGLYPEVFPAQVDEQTLEGEAPEAVVLRLAEAKARWVAALHPTALVLGADTLVYAGSQLLGKPTDRADAARMLSILAGRTHEVLTGYFLTGPMGTRSGVVSTQVTFRQLFPGELDWYLGSADWQDRAGGYAVQSQAAGFVIGIVGSYTSVVGLPLAEVLVALFELGHGR